MPSGLIGLIKQAALDANDNAQLCDLRFGTVVSVNPLKVQVTNLFTIPESLLIVPQHLTEYSVNVKLNWTTDSPSDYHNHPITGTKTMTINNSLKVNDKVALLRKTGGQSYFILDRI